MQERSENDDHCIRLCDNNSHAYSCSQWSVKRTERQSWPELLFAMVYSKFGCSFTRFFCGIRSTLCFQHIYTQITATRSFHWAVILCRAFTRYWNRCVTITSTTKSALWVYELLRGTKSTVSLPPWITTQINFGVYCSLHTQVCPKWFTISYTRLPLRLALGAIKRSTSTF